MSARRAREPETKPARRTQAERRSETRAAVLDSACRQFGTKGYADTSLESIAGDCGLTIAPIYHYFGNKRALFEAVVERMNDRILESLQRVSDGEGTGGSAAWRAYLQLCEDAGFRRIVLIDAPSVLGREGWSESPVYRTAAALLRRSDGSDTPIGDLERRILLAGLAEAALAIAESNNPRRLAKESEATVARLLEAFRD